MEQLWPEEPQWKAYCEALQTASELSAIVWIAWQMGLWLAQAIVQEQVRERATQPQEWPSCPKCGRRLTSKGFEPRRIQTLVGWVSWRRRIGRCPEGCPGVQQAPFDRVLGIHPYQQTSKEVIRLGCLLCVFLPYELSAWMLEQFSGLHFQSDTLWRWVQQAGKQAMKQLEAQLAQLAAGQLPEVEQLEAAVAQMSLAIGADGVTVPFRRHAGSPKGKIQWREVKIAVLARLGHHISRTGKAFTRLHQRRLVAVLGDIDQLAVRLQLEAIRQGINEAKQVVWLCDGGRGFWRLYRQCFAQLAVGVLDFYHAAGQLWEAASAYLDGRTSRARWWFTFMRHLLRQGNWSRVLNELLWAMHRPDTTDSARETLQKVHDYLFPHRTHITYRHFEQMGLPLGSGMVESACKWLIQQRFKGVGMRWSDDGFNHLLHLRLAWVNDRFDSLFPGASLSPILASPNH